MQRPSGRDILKSKKEKERFCVELIVAVDQNWAIGRGGDQLFYIPADLKRFKTLTMGHPVILGRKTLATFPGGRPLKGRENLILSADPAFRVEGAAVYRNLDDLLAAAPANSFVIGGGSVYQALLPYCDTAHVTKVEAAFPADTWFPDLDADPAWQVGESSEPQEHEGMRFRYVTYYRR